MAKVIASIYGEALYELAAEEKKTGLFLTEIKAVQAVLHENTEFTKLMTHPKLSKEEKMEAVGQVFRGRVSREIAEFIRIMVEKDRWEELDKACTYFVDRVKEVMGIGAAYVTTAVPADKSMQKKVRARLLKTTHYKDMEMHYTVDPSIVGGMIIRIGDRVMDSSIATMLSNLRRQLLQKQVD